jgi:hypothetical protein
MSPVMWSPDSEYAKERRRWESTHSEFGPPGRPAVGTEFPLMIYRAKRSPNGGPPIIEHHIVDDEQQERNMRSRGFVRGPDNAIKELEASEQGVAIAAAERAAADRKMSAKAQAEAVAVDETTISHLGSIPETPIHKKGWPKGKPRKQVAP